MASAGASTRLGNVCTHALQIITIEQALKGVKPAIPPIDTGAMFKRGARKPTANPTEFAPAFRVKALAVGDRGSCSTLLHF